MIKPHIRLREETLLQFMKLDQVESGHAWFWHLEAWHLRDQALAQTSGALPQVVEYGWTLDGAIHRT
jgi:hypothetical protein